MIILLSFMSYLMKYSIMDILKSQIAKIYQISLKLKVMSLLKVYNIQNLFNTGGSYSFIYKPVILFHFLSFLF